MKTTCEEQVSDFLTQTDLAHALLLINRFLTSNDTATFNKHLLAFSSFLGFEFVRYAYTKQSYTNKRKVHLENISSPQEWAAEYDREGYMHHDPIRHEVERKIANGEKSALIHWKDYPLDLSPLQQKVIARRKHYGMYHGFSFFIDSTSKDFTFLISFSSKKSQLPLKTEILCKFLGPHLLATRKRLVIQELIAALSEKEKAIASWIMEGKTNWEIAQLLGITENTVKFHIKKIFPKLQVANRQQVIALMLAERYLNI